MKAEFTDDDLRLIAGLAREEIKRCGSAEQIKRPGARVQLAKRQVDMRRLVEKVRLIRVARRPEIVPY